MSVIEALCSALHRAPGWKSCAHLSYVVRSSLMSAGATDKEVQEVAEVLGVSLDPISRARRAELVAAGLLP